MPDLTPLEAAEILGRPCDYSYGKIGMARQCAASYLRKIAAGEYKQVVHCGLCKNRVYRGGYGGYCSVMGMAHVNDDDFCSYGVRKDDGKHD